MAQHPESSKEPVKGIENEFMVEIQTIADVAEELKRPQKDWELLGGIQEKREQQS